MQRKRYAKEPLLYIHQPTRQQPEARMQQDYYSPPKSENKGVPETMPKQNKQRRVVRRRFPTDQVEYEDEDELGEEKDHEQTASAQEEDANSDDVVNNSHFNDLTIEQKIAYFINMPSNAPAVRCEIQTEERKYRGIIVESKDDHVFMRVGRRVSTTEIAVKDIEDIILLGF